MVHHFTIQIPSISGSGFSFLLLCLIHQSSQCSSNFLSEDTLKFKTKIRRKILTVWKRKFLTVWKGNFWQFGKEIFDSLERKFWQFGKEIFDSLERKFWQFGKGKHSLRITVSNKRNRLIYYVNFINLINTIWIYVDRIVIFVDPFETGLSILGQIDLLKNFT